MENRLSRFFGAQDMTTGTPLSCLVRFSVPLLVGNIAQQLYNAVDSVVVGQYVGNNALAAVGGAGPLLQLMFVFFIGISVGASVMISQYYGARQREQLSRTIGSTLTITLIVSIFLMIVGTFITDPLLRLLKTPDEIIGMTSTYVKIIFWGIAGTAYYNIVSGMLRGFGDSVVPLIYLLVSCGLNIVLDLLFVIVFDMGVAGVAWATIIAQIVSSILSIIRLTRMKDKFTLKLAYLKPQKKSVLQLLRLGLPSGLTQAVFAMASIIIQPLTNSFGPTVIATANVVMRVDGFAMMPNFTFGTAMTTYTGQNIGAERMDRVDQGTKTGMRLGVAVSCILVLLLLIFGPMLIGLFTNNEDPTTPMILELGTRMIRMLAIGYIAMAITQILSGVMRGAGDTVIPMWISIFTTVIMRIPVAYGYSWLTRSDALPNGSSDCIFASLLASWVVGAILTVIFFRVGKWRNKGITKKVPDYSDEEAIAGDMHLAPENV